MATAASEEDDLWDFSTPGGAIPLDMSSGGEASPACQREILTMLIPRCQPQQLTSRTTLKTLISL
jgi:hypothetical protein